MRVKPKLNYKLLGTDIVLDNTKIYPAIPASNLPEWEKTGKIFVGDNVWDCNVMLERDQYTIVDK